MANYRCVASGVFASGRTWSFRQHFSSGSAISVVQGDWHTQIGSFWTNGSHGVETLYPTTTVLTLTSTAELDSSFREGNKQEATETLAGTGTDDGLPEQDCILISLRAAQVGRKNRGRIHLPAPIETVVDAGELQSTPSARASTAINALYAGMRLAGHTPFIYNVKVSPHDPVLFTQKDIVTELVDRQIRTLRGRSKGKRAVYV
jgi:hypothetical protein